MPENVYGAARTATLNALAKLEPLLVLKDRLEAAEDAERYIAEAEGRRAKVEQEIATLRDAVAAEAQTLHDHEVRTEARIKALDDQLAARRALLTRQFQDAQADQEARLAALEAQVIEKQQAAAERIAQHQAAAKAAQGEVTELERRIGVLRETEAALRKSIGG